MSDFTVKLMAVTEDSQLISAAGALGCFDEDVSYEVLEKLLFLSPEERDKKCKAVLKNSFGMGHGAVGDQNCFIFSIENLPRAATLQLCLPEYAAHLQQSLRRAKPERGFHVPEVIKNSSLFEETEAVLNESFQFYKEATSAGIPGEDARYLLPLYTRTNIQTAVDARELCHLWAMSNRDGVPLVVKAVVGEMMFLAEREAPHLFENFGANYESLAWNPSSQLFAEENKTIERLVDRYETKDRQVVLLDQPLLNEAITTETIREAIQNRNEAELANLKHIHFEFLALMSLACFHQATRQRTWNQSVESIYDAAFCDLVAPLSRMFIPESIKKSMFAGRYKNLYHRMIKLFGSLIRILPMSEAIGVVPHSLMVYDWIHVNGWNAIHAIGKRTCTKAQLEIRRIAWAMARQIRKAAPIFDGYVEPQCITYGKCPEKEPCDYVERKKAREKKKNK
ncbi:MAG: FAD-dependent thymidylate synthase [Candidatus Azambacteria bacterium]|nr:FAD-dependent thymidylate synthase [Candidatus Azambacteria bacterium]